MKRHPYLAASLRLKSATGGTCFHRSAALMLDLRGATLVFGVLRAATPEEQAKTPGASPVPFIHAWVEYRNMLLAPTTLERTGMELKAMPLADYYRVNAITTTWRLDHAAFMQVAKRWNLASALKHNSARAGDGRMVDALLAAAGVRYRLSDRRTVLPID